MFVTGSSQASNASAAYQIPDSLRFQSASTQNLTRTPASNGNLRRWTYSAWIKRGLISNASQNPSILTATLNASFNESIYFVQSTDVLVWNVSNTLVAIQTTQVFRDPSAWYHIVLVWDTDNATAANRARIYVNGSEVTAFSVDNRASISARDSTFNRGSVVNYVGGSSNSVLNYDGYLTEVNFIDGQALTPASFGATNPYSGQWVATKYLGTYGTNGFYLPFSNGTSTTTLGADGSGNGNNWTLNNFTRSAGVSDCWMNDVPSGNGGAGTQPNSNYCVANPLDKGTSFVTVTGANLVSTTTIGGAPLVRGSMGVTSGKWYWEITPTSMSRASIGIANNFANPALEVGGDANSWGYLQDARKYNGGTATSYGATYANNDVIGVGLDMDAGTLTFYKNGVSQGQAFSGITGTIFPACSRFGGTGTDVLAWNFGNRSFAYTPPSGFKALCTGNLPASSIVKGNQYMDATLYTGNGGTLAVTNSGSMQPDFVWCKSRSQADQNVLMDTVRGVVRRLYSNLTNAEDATGGLASVNSNGFSLNSSSSSINNNTITYVGWQWQAGKGVNTTNTDGTLASVVSVNKASGFSIVTYTGSGTAATVGHGLGVQPKMVIIKQRNAVTNWAVNHVSIWSTGQGVMYLNLTNANSNDSTFWNSTNPTTSVIYLGTNASVNGNGSTFVAYCWAEIAGFSKFGSYTGNGSSDGPFVYTGFRPEFILTKRIDSATNANWVIHDATRSPFNVAGKALFPNLTNAEDNNEPNAQFDLLSNGFKVRTTSDMFNGNGSTYLYAAFAENPFANSNAR